MINLNTTRNLAGYAVIAFIAGCTDLQAQAIDPTDASSGYTLCATEHETCSFSGTRTILYGANGQYAQREATDSIGCNNLVFGDPIPGTLKACYSGPVTGESSEASDGGSNGATDGDSGSDGSDNGGQACTSLEERVLATTLSVPSTPAPSDEYTPAILAPAPSGESLLAWTDTQTRNIRLARLDANDQLVETWPAISGLEAHDAISTPGGYAVAVMDNDPDIYSPKYCRGADTPGNAVCGKMDVVLLNGQGKPEARTTLTSKANVDSDGARFIWWYGHTARLATDGTHIGAYFRSAMSTTRPNASGEVDIHAGDSLHFIDAMTAMPVDGGWEWGCSHSWSVRLAHNGNNWAAACHGDSFPNAMRLSRLTQLEPMSNITWLDNTDPAKRALGGLVPNGDGFWLDYLQTEGSALTLKLARFSDSLDRAEQTLSVDIATNLDNVYPYRPYMAAYDSDKLLLGWKSNGKLHLAVANANSGEILEGPVETSLSIDTFQEMKTSENGDVVWAHASGNGNEITVNRISACGQ